MSYNHNLQFLWYNLVVPIGNVITPFVNIVIGLCKKNNLIKKNDDKEEDFIPACFNGDVEKIKRLQALFKVDLNKGLTEAVQTGQETAVVYLIKQGATNLDENLKIACLNNKYGVAEILVQNGARTVVGLRVAKSPNIIKMLHRYEQNSELINY